MFNDILIVCVGNICRSPMAEALFKLALAQGHRTVGSVTSAGLSALAGEPADPKAALLVQAVGLDISGHRAKQLTPQIVRKAELILVMEQCHKTAIENQEPSAKGKVFRLGNWHDIPDPYQKDMAAFEFAFAQIDQSVKQWMNRLYP